MARGTNKEQDPSNNKLYSDADLQEVKVTGRKRIEQILNPDSYRKSKVLLESFPSNIESDNLPYMMIKIFETTTGAAPVVDPLTASLRSTGKDIADGVTKLSNAVPGGAELIAGAAVGAATGSFLAGAGAAIFGEQVLGAAQEVTGVNFVETFKKRLSDFNLKRNTVQLAHSIALFMPDGLNVNYDQEYDAISITQTLGVVGALAQAIADKKGGQSVDPYIMEAAAAAAGNILGSGGDFTRVGLFGTTGFAVNPQLELMYTSPTLRKFVFDFRLVPRNAKESEAIKRILYLLRFYSAPTIPKGTSGRYYIPPAQFEIEFYDSGNKLNSFLFKTKKCALTSISVDYSPNGFATFADGAPVETRLQLQFQETAIMDRASIDTEAGLVDQGRIDLPRQEQG